MTQARWACGVAFVAMLAVMSCLEAQVPPQTVTLRIDNQTDKNVHVLYSCEDGRYVRRIGLGGPNEITTTDVRVVDLCVGGDLVLSHGEMVWRAPDPGLSEDGYASCLICACDEGKPPNIFPLPPEISMPLACGKLLCAKKPPKLPRSQT